MNNQHCFSKSESFLLSELVCCVVGAGVVVDGIGVGGHVRGKQLVMQMDGAVEQSCWM
jgi:hypothetical protein